MKKRTYVISALAAYGLYRAGKKFVDYLNNYGQIEPLTDNEIRQQLGIGATDEFAIRQKTSAQEISAR